MIDPAVLRGRLVAIDGLHETQAAICAAQGQPHLAAACDNARIGVLEAIAVVDAMTAGRELLPLPDATTTPTLFTMQETTT